MSFGAFVSSVKVEDYASFDQVSDHDLYGTNVYYRLPDNVGVPEYRNACDWPPAGLHFGRIDRGNHSFLPAETRWSQGESGNHPQRTTAYQGAMAAFGNLCIIRSRILGDMRAELRQRERNARMGFRDCNLDANDSFAH